MCPGGYVVNSSSEENKLVINGMSNYERDSGIANSAIIVTVNEKDYGSSLFAGMKFQEELEKKAYLLANGNIPVQTYLDYSHNQVQDKVKFTPQIKGTFEYANLNELFSNDINESLKKGIGYFDTKISGFANENVLLAGVESRTSSPIRIKRNDNMESNIKGIYPIGEGAGYAGGIMSASVDGIKVFEEVCSVYHS